MPERPFWLSDVVVLAANSAGTLIYQVSAAEEFFGKKIWIVSTAAFSIEDIRDNAGMRYSNCSASEPILSTMLDKPQVTGEGLLWFGVELHMMPSGILYIDLKDTSGAPNTVSAVIVGRKVTV